MTVAIVVDPRYPELEQLAEQMPIWAIDNSHHRVIAERWWKLRGCADATQGITLFKVSEETNAEENCLGVIDDVDLHHGIYSSGSAIAVLNVFGTPLSDRVQDKLKTLGFVTFRSSPGGFVALAREG